MDRFKGFRLSPRFPYAVVGGAGGAGFLVRELQNNSIHEQLLSPEGFTLRVRAVGGRLEMYLNDMPMPILDAVDDDPLPAGRVALFAYRLFPTYESLVIEPLSSDD